MIMTMKVKTNMSLSRMRMNDFETGYEEPGVAAFLFHESHSFFQFFRKKTAYSKENQDEDF